MATNQQYYTIFNNKLKELINDLIAVIPDKDLLTLRNGFNIIKMNNEKEPQRIFAQGIEPFRNKLLAKDESFFLQKDYTEYVQDESAFNIIEKIKKHWNDLGKDKETVWKYLFMLIKISDKCA